jgi:protoheme IX farnesyltransferase
MVRTRTRPLPEHRVTSPAALRFGVTISVLGALELAMFVNPLTSLLSLISLFTYLFWYTPLKTRTSLCTLVGAIPGAIPPMMGWTAAAGQLEAGAWVLFGILFLWQLPHFLAIAWMYREDYKRAGFPMLPVIDPNGASTGRMILLYCLLLIPMSLLPLRLGMAGVSYGFGAIFLGIGFLALGIMTAWRRTVFQARRLLLGSVVYLPTLLSWMAWSR